MSVEIDDLVERITRLERELETEFSQAKARWRYRIDDGRVRFDRQIRQAHRRLKKSVPKFLRESDLGNLLTAPVIYSLIVPIAALDLWITAYQAVCFRVYRIARVRRSDYIAFDRHHLAYLNVIEKMNCLYCSYANGVFGYVREVAGRTEQYWCPIRHARRVRAPHAHYRQFVDYGDAKGYRQRLLPLRGILEHDRTNQD